MSFLKAQFVAGLWALLFVPFLTVSVHAENGTDFRVEGNAILFDTELEEKPNAEIDASDVDVLLSLLRQNPDVKLLRLNSQGGAVWPAQSIAEIIADFELATEIVSICSSSCAVLFLAGDPRTMPKGARLGFHQWNWKPASVEDYYNDLKARNGWATPFEFASWLYQDTQDEVSRHLRFMLQRGVDPQFALETIRYRGDRLWYPSRNELVAAGVLTNP